LDLLGLEGPKNLVHEPHERHQHRQRQTITIHQREDVVSGRAGRLGEQKHLTGGCQRANPGHQGPFHMGRHWSSFSRLPRPPMENAFRWPVVTFFHVSGSSTLKPPHHATHFRSTTAPAIPWSRRDCSITFCFSFVKMADSTTRPIPRTSPSPFSSCISPPVRAFSTKSYAAPSMVSSEITSPCVSSSLRSPTLTMENQPNTRCCASSLETMSPSIANEPSFATGSPV